MTTSLLRLPRLFIAAAAFLASALGVPAMAADKVVLQLKWTHAFQFAGYYAAKEMGYYRAAGLDVEIRAIEAGKNSVEEVVSGRADFGVSTSSLLLERHAGKPVVALAAIFQHSPMVLVAAGTSPIRTLQELAGKRIMIEPHADELLAYLQKEGVPVEGMVRVEHRYDVQDLLDGRIAAMTAYLTSEPYYLDRAGFRYQIYTPRAAGIDFYGDTLFTSESQLRNHPERVRAFREASVQGWKYAMANPEKIVQLIYEKYSADHPVDYYRFEARQMVSLIQADMVEPGYMHEGRWRHIANVYADIGLLPRDVDFGDFIYTAEQRKDLDWIYRTFGMSIALLVAVSVVALRFLMLLRKLRESDGRFRTLFRNMPDPAWIVRGHTLIDANDAAVQRLGFDNKEALLRQAPASLAPAMQPDGQSSAEKLAHELAVGTRHGRHEFSFVFTGKNGEMIDAEVTLAEIMLRGEPALYCIWRDVTERRAAEERIRQMAQTDMLTGLPNRALMFDRLHLALAMAKRDKTQLAVMFFDLDAFKPINDRLGHEAGDAVLKAAAQRMRGALRASDTVARIGGDEFLVLLPEIDGREAVEAVAAKIYEALRQPLALGDEMHDISASLGVAIYPADGDQDEVLVRHADEAMYRAKAAGGNRSVFYTA